MRSLCMHFNTLWYGFCVQQFFFVVIYAKLLVATIRFSQTTLEEFFHEKLRFSFGLWCVPIMCVCRANWLRNDLEKGEFKAYGVGMNLGFSLWCVDTARHIGNTLFRHFSFAQYNVRQHTTATTMTTKTTINVLLVTTMTTTVTNIKT